MRRIAYARLVLRAIFELARYDCQFALFGFRRARRLAATRSRTAGDGEATIAAVCDAVVLATCLYWKPVLCLQRSVCAARLLRGRGITGRLVIGYRPVPFFSHAWVEVDGRVVNDSPVYQKRLRVLHTA